MIVLAAVFVFVCAPQSNSALNYSGQLDMSVLTDVLWCTWWSAIYSGGQLCGTKAYLTKEWSTHARPRDAVLALGLDYLSHECVPRLFLPLFGRI